MSFSRREPLIARWKPRRCHVPHVVAALVSAAALTATPRAMAAACNITGDNVVYVSGASAAVTYLATLAVVLQADFGVQLVFVQTDSCTGDIDILTSTTPQGAKAATADTWTAGVDGGAPVESTCTISGTSTPATGFNIDVGISDVYASSCLQTLSPGYAEFDGPVQAFALIVNANSASAGKSISAEAAHILFKDIVAGTTQTYPIPPWTDPTQIWIREGIANGGSGTRLLAGLAFDPPFLPTSDATNWSSAIPAANVVSSGATLAGDVAADTATPGVNASLGIVAASVADPLRSTVSVLAFQGAGQTCGYYPDSNQKTSYDKINVREGRYQMWGPEHIVTAVASPGDGGAPVPVSTSNPGNATSDAAVQAFVNAFTQGGAGLGTLSVAQNEQIIASAAQTSFVPTCAMRVRHSTGVDVGPVQSYLPTDSCGCYWDSIADKTATPEGCTACPTGNECAGLTATPTCRYGFCEAD